MHIFILKNLILHAAVAENWSITASMLLVSDRWICSIIGQGVSPPLKL